MDTGETTGVKPPPKRRPPAPEEPPYEGTWGRTRLESIHVTIPGGFVRAVQVYTAVNVATDPELRGAAKSGALHRFEGGEELAIPFVYHDPEARKLALVLPESLRHRELHERARLIERIAQDTEHAVPPYVRAGRVVIGPGELAAYLDEDAAPDLRLHDRERELSSRDAELSSRDAELSSRQEQVTSRSSELSRLEAELTQRREELEKQIERLVDREKRLHARAEDVTRREDEVRLIQEETEASKRDLEMREQELERRLAVVQERERDLEGRAAEGRAAEERAAEGRAAEGRAAEGRTAEGRAAEAEGQASPDAAHPAEARPRSVPPPPPPASKPPAPPLAAELADEEDVEELEELEAVRTDANVKLSEAVELLDDSDGDRISVTDVEEIADEEDVEEIEDIDAVREVTGVEPVPEPPAEDDEPTRVAQVEPRPELDVEPPERFLREREIEMMATLSDGVRLFARLDDGRGEAFRERADLLVQLSVVQGYPVVLLSLVDDAEGRPYVRHAALDPRNADDRRLLEALQKDFAATVALFGHGGSLEGTIEVSAPRRVNVAMVLERCDRISAPPLIDASTALERALAVPPPVREQGLPFQTEEPPPSESALEAARALDTLSQWSTPERIERALLELSVPRDVVDGSMRRILGDAVRHGVALPPALVSRAVSVGVAAEPGELLTQQIAAFRKTCMEPEAGGLTPEQVADNWERLLDSAARIEVAIDSDTHEVAWAAIRAVRSDSVVPRSMADVDPTKLPELGAPELVLLLEHPKVRRLAAFELCRRSEPELLDTLFKAVRKMPRGEVVRVVPRIAEFGEVAGDVLIDGLSSKKTFVRQSAALALGHLRLRRAVVPLLHLLENEPSEVWREVARVLGEFGNGALRALTRGLKDPRRQAERFAWALAHLANHGCEKQVEQLAANGGAKVSEVAREALTLREQAARASEAVRAQQRLDQEDPILQFSQRFYAELSGDAPELDLADVHE